MIGAWSYRVNHVQKTWFSPESGLFYICHQNNFIWIPVNIRKHLTVKIRKIETRTLYVINIAQYLIYKYILKSFSSSSVTKIFFLNVLSTYVAMLNFFWGRNKFPFKGCQFLPYLLKKFLQTKRTVHTP
jgi:hypothetical protein